MIKVENLTKRFGLTRAVDNVSFHVGRGEIVGFLGPNGAGKTTTMRILACFIAPTAGTVMIDGLDALRDSLEVRRRIGYLPENVPLYSEMRVREYLEFRGRLKGLGGRRLRARVDEVISRCSLGEVRRSVIGVLSKGYRQRVGLADALVHDPEVLLLDEPTIGLDPNQIRHIRDLIRSLAANHTILLSTHILPEAEMICGRVLIMHRGRVLASDTADNLVRMIRGSMRVVVEASGGPRDALRDALAGVAGVIGVSAEFSGDWHRFSCACEAGADPRAGIFRAIAGRGWVLRELRVERTNLEDVFVSLTSGENGG